MGCLTPSPGAGCAALMSDWSVSMVWNSEGKKKNIKYKRYLIFSLYKVELIIKYCNKIHKKLRPSSWQIKFNFFFLLLLLLKLLKLYVIGSFERFGLWPRAVIGVLFLEMEKKRDIMGCFCSELREKSSSFFPSLLSLFWIMLEKVISSCALKSGCFQNTFLCGF